EQRREGDVLGAAQAGRKKSLKLLSVLRDRDLIVTARKEATDLVDADPELAGYPALAAEMGALLDEEQAGFLAKTGDDGPAAAPASRPAVRPATSHQPARALRAQAPLQSHCYLSPLQTRRLTSSAQRECGRCDTAYLLLWAPSQRPQTALGWSGDAGAAGAAG